MIAGIVLAAGEAKRMGKPKQLLPYQGETLLGNTLARVTPVLERVVVVLGASAETISAYVDFHGAEVVINPEYRTGQASSLVAGLHTIATKAEVTGVIVFLGDQPTVHSEAITAICDYHLAHPDVATIVPRYGEHQGNPVFFARSAWQTLLLGVTGDMGARHLIAQGEPAPLVSMAFPEAWYPQDIDTWEDYRALVGEGS